jgi:hypothetical protein
MKKPLTSINIRFLSTAITFLFMVVFLSGTASAQAPAKNKREADKKFGSRQLAEAKVTAKVVSSVEEVAPMKVRLNVLNPTGKEVTIAILNQNNELVYREAFRGNEYHKILNFNTTLQGRYMLHITGPKYWELHRFAINSDYQRVLNESALEMKNSADVMAVIYKIDPAKVLVHIVNHTGKPVDYQIRDNQKALVYSGRVSKAQFSRVLNMAEMDNGQYTIAVKNHADITASRTYDLKGISERSFAWIDKRGRPLENTGYTTINKNINKKPVTTEPSVNVSGLVVRK